jgi:hypothetical protein
MQATAISTNTLTVVRAQFSTTAIAFADLDTIEIRMLANYLETPFSAATALEMPVDLTLNGNFINFGGSSTSTAYNITSVGGVPQMTGAANYKYTFTSNSLVMNAGTTWYSMTLANSAGFTLTTNNVVRIQANNSGVQFGATGARITHIDNDGTLASASATTGITSLAAKTYADSVGGGAPEGTAVLSTGEVGGTKFLREDGDGTCSWQNATSTFTPSSTDTLTNKTIDANGTGNSISNIDIADLANGTDGELITWDASGAPAAVAVGTANQVLTSNGAGAAPTMQDVAGNPYYFSAYKAGAQTVSDSVSTIIQFDTEIADPSGDYDNTTNYRYTPSKAGYYTIVAGVAFASFIDGGYLNLVLSDGTATLAQAILTNGGARSCGTTVTAVLYFNGTTDYVVAKAYHINGGASKSTFAGIVTNFSGYRIIQD